MALYDTYHMEERLIERFSEVVRIDFDERRNRHKIIAADKHNEEYTMFTVPLGELDFRTEFDLVKITSPRYNALGEVEEYEAKVEKDNESYLSDVARNMADDLYKPLRKAALY